MAERVGGLSVEEKLELIHVLFQRGQIKSADGRESFKRAYPHAPDEMISAASFHVYVDGVDAVLSWLASAELFLRNSDDSDLYSETIHVLYHLYNYEQFRVLLPKGTPRVLEALQEIKDALTLEQDSETALAILKELEDRFGGELNYPQFDPDLI